jgi:predicted hydrolase (HD superfamily)
MKAKSVRKKMKQASFAAAVNRDDIVNGAADPGVELNEHIDFVNPSRRLMSRAVSC